MRSVEIIYASGKTDILISARTVEDMTRYLDLFDSAYGQLTYEKIEDTIPGFFQQIPYIVGLDT